MSNWGLALRASFALIIASNSWFMRLPSFKGDEFIATSASSGIPVRLVVSGPVAGGGLIEHRSITNDVGVVRWIHMPLAGTTIVSAASGGNSAKRTRTISIVYHGPRSSWCLVD